MKTDNQFIDLAIDTLEGERKKMKLNQTKFAKHLEIPVGSYNAIVTGKRCSIRKFVELMERLGYEVDITIKTKKSPEKRNQYLQRKIDRLKSMMVNS